MCCTIQQAHSKLGFSAHLLIVLRIYLQHHLLKVDRWQIARWRVFIIVGNYLYTSSVVWSVDSHIQRFVLTAEETTVRWYNKSAIDLSSANHACGYKEVPRSTDHIMVTTRYSDEQGSKTRQKVNRLYKQWHRPITKWFIKPPYSISRAASIDSDCCRLPTTSVLSNKQSGQITLQPILTKSMFLKATHRTKLSKFEIPRSMVVEALSWWSQRASQHPAVQSPVHPWKSPTNLARSPLLVALVGTKTNVVRDQLFPPQKPPGPRLWFSRAGVQPSPGSSTIELATAFAESGAYLPYRALPGFPRRCSLPLACRHPPEGHQIGARKRRTPGVS